MAQYPSLKEKLAAGSPVIGGGLSSKLWFPIDAYIAAGYDFLGIDTQHSPINVEDAVDLITPLKHFGFPTIIRTNANNDAQIGKALDGGAEGVIVPMVNNGAEAAKVAAAAKYPPKGVRSNGAFRADVGALSHADRDEHGLIFAMIETAEGFEKAEEIIATDGIHGIYIGPSDLSIALGMEGYKGFTTDQLKGPIETIKALCEKHGKYLGAFSGSVENNLNFISWGVQLVNAGNEQGYMAAGATQFINALRAGEGSGGASAY